MTTTRQLAIMQDTAAEQTPIGIGRPTHLWLASVVTVNPDGTVDAQPIGSRATKVAVPVPNNYAPTVGDLVAMTYMSGERQYPYVLAPIAQTIPTVTGSQSDGSALASLLGALAGLNLIIDNTSE